MTVTSYDYRPIQLKTGAGSSGEEGSRPGRERKWQRKLTERLAVVRVPSPRLSFAPTFAPRRSYGYVDENHSLILRAIVETLVPAPSSSTFSEADRPPSFHLVV